MMYPNPLITPEFIRQVAKERLEANGVLLDKCRIPDFDEAPIQDKPARATPWRAITSLFPRRSRAA